MVLYTEVSGRFVIYSLFLVLYFFCTKQCGGEFKENQWQT